MKYEVDVIVKDKIDDDDDNNLCYLKVYTPYTFLDGRFSSAQTDGVNLYKRYRFWENPSAAGFGVSYHEVMRGVKFRGIIDCVVYI